MTGTCHACGTDAARAGGEPTRFVRGAVRGLQFAAAPVFAIMALLSASGGNASDILCTTTQDASPLTGMFPMYVLMSTFHLAPWLRLMSR
jgi:hypothetical protein